MEQNQGKVILLSIAIDKYQDSTFEDLQNAVFDSQELTNVLEKKYKISKKVPIHDKNCLLYTSDAADE